MEVYSYFIPLSSNCRGERAGSPKMRFHDLRHSMATILLAAGVHPKVVQERLGHSSIKITMDVYSHVLPSMQDDVARMLGEMFKDEYTS